LDTSYNHPGGIQIHDNVLAIPFGKGGQNAKINFYALNNPVQPVLSGSYATDGSSIICAGLTDYNDKYLLALYCGREGRIKFYHFDKSFNNTGEKTWSATNQNRENWYPVNEWQDGKQHYENMSLLKVMEDSLTTPKYYLFMYHNNPEAIDVFSLSEPDLTSDLDVQMIYRIKVSPKIGSGFRMGGGLYIADENEIQIFSPQKHITGKTLINRFGSKKLLKP
jgi:hypothetical protein